MFCTFAAEYRLQAFKVNPVLISLIPFVLPEEWIKIGRSKGRKTKRRGKRGGGRHGHSELLRSRPNPVLQGEVFETFGPKQYFHFILHATLC